MRFRCFNGICVCLRLDPTTQTPGGIILPDVAQKKSERVQVLEVCPAWVRDGKERTSNLKPGDIALISKYSGQEFEIRLETGADLRVVLVKEDDILCVIDDYDPRTITEAPARGIANNQVYGDGLQAPVPAVA